jgi:hypothetical protein
MVFVGVHFKHSSKQGYYKTLRWPPNQTFDQRLAKIDILLSHVKLSKRSIVCVCKRIFSGEDGAIQKFHLVIYRFSDPLN